MSRLNIASIEDKANGNPSKKAVDPQRPVSSPLNATNIKLFCSGKRE